MEILYFIGIYLIGFILTMTFLKFFGKKILIDYDNADLYDDYHSNAEAYTVFSSVWFITIPVGIIMGSVMLMLVFSGWYMKVLDKLLKL
jgi:hypothetical protein